MVLTALAHCPEINPLYTHLHDEILWKQSPPYLITTCCIVILLYTFKFGLMFKLFLLYLTVVTGVILAVFEDSGQRHPWGIHSLSNALKENKLIKWQEEGRVWGL